MNKMDGMAFIIQSYTEESGLGSLVQYKDDDPQVKGNQVVDAGKGKTKDPFNSEANNNKMTTVNFKLLGDGNDLNEEGYTRLTGNKHLILRF